MKRFQSLLCASLLTLAVSASAFAGDITSRSSNISRSGDITSHPSNIKRSGDITSIVQTILGVIASLP